jgi:hypothetical protein
MILISICQRTSIPISISINQSAIALLLASTLSCFTSSPCLLEDGFKSISHLGLSCIFNEQRHQLLILTLKITLSDSNATSCSITCISRYTNSLYINCNTNSIYVILASRLTGWSWNWGWSNAVSIFITVMNLFFRKISFTCAILILLFSFASEW